MNIKEKTVQADFAIKKANEYKSQKRYNADGTIEEVMRRWKTKAYRRYLQ